jgi:hypothetical protein
LIAHKTFVDQKTGLTGQVLPLDAHAHLDPERTSDELADSGAVLAMTLSLDEAARVVDRHEPYISWGVGCHPRNLKAQESFNAGQFRELAQRERFHPWKGGER